MKDESKEDYINFCIKCFKGHFCIDLNAKKGWGLKCDTCSFAVRMFEGAVRVKKQGGDDKRCQECGSFQVNVLYRENENHSLPPGQLSHTGCILCDTWLRSEIKSVLKPQKLMTVAEEKEALRLMEERKKLKEERKALKQKQKTENQTKVVEETEG